MSDSASVQLIQERNRVAGNCIECGAPRGANGTKHRCRICAALDVHRHRQRNMDLTGVFEEFAAAVKARHPELRRPGRKRTSTWT